MGKWIKLTDNGGSTVCLKYVPGMDRFIDHGSDRVEWFRPLTIAANNTSGVTQISPFAPSAASLQQYAASVAGLSDAALRQANTHLRFVTFTADEVAGRPWDGAAMAGPFSAGLIYNPYHPGRNRLNWVDAYTLTDVHAVSVVNSDPVIAAVIQAPDRVYTPPVNRSGLIRWRVPLVSLLTFPVEVSGQIGQYNNAAQILDSVYSQLEYIFGPF